MQEASIEFDVSGKISTGIIRYSETDPYWVEAIISDKVVHSDGLDLFAALQEVRRSLWKAEISPLVNGARVDAYPSSMTREMSGGLLAYLHELGVRPSKSDLVNIFDRADASMIGSVESQEKYFSTWQASIS